MALLHSDFGAAKLLTWTWCWAAWSVTSKPPIARRGTEHDSGLGTQRWVVERAFAHLHWFRRLRIRWEIRDDIHEAFLALGCALICWRRLSSFR
jgi:transposase